MEDKAYYRIQVYLIILKGCDLHYLCFAVPPTAPSHHHIYTSMVRFSSVQDGICALEIAHTRSIPRFPSLKYFPNTWTGFRQSGDPETPRYGSTVEYVISLWLIRPTRNDATRKACTCSRASNQPLPSSGR